MQRLQSFRLYHFRDAKVERVAKDGEFQILSFFRIPNLKRLQRLQSFTLYHFHDIKVARVAKVGESFTLNHFHVIKIATVAKVGEFQSLSFSGYQRCEGCKGCNVSVFIIFRISGL